MFTTNKKEEYTVFSIPVSFILILVMYPLHWLRTWAPALQFWPMIWPDDDIFTSRSPEKSQKNTFRMLHLIRSTNTLLHIDSIYVFFSAPIHQKSTKHPMKSHDIPSPCCSTSQIRVLCACRQNQLVHGCHAGLLEPGVFKQRQLKRFLRLAKYIQHQDKLKISILSVVSNHQIHGYWWLMWLCS